MWDFSQKFNFSPSLPGMTDKLDFLEGDKKKGKESAQGSNKAVNKRA